MKNLLFLLIAGSMFIASCATRTDCYTCLTLVSNNGTYTNYTYIRTDTFRDCNMTSKDARKYEEANTINAPMDNHFPGETRTTRCDVSKN